MANGNHQPASPVSPVPATAKEVPESAPKANKPPLPDLTAKDIQASGVSPTNAALESSLAATTTDQEKLQVAMKEIDRLKAQLAEAQSPQVTGLRRRGGGASDASGVEVMTEKAKKVVSGTSGVPLEVTGGLMLVVFILTYLFF